MVKVKVEISAEFEVSEYDIKVTNIAREICDNVIQTPVYGTYFLKIKKISIEKE